MGDGHDLRVGMRVKDLDGKALGKVSRRDAHAFEVVRGFFGPREWVVRYDEIVEVKDGIVTIARSDEALFELAAGRLPATWRRTLPQ